MYQVDYQVSRGANNMMVAGKIEGLQGGIANQVKCCFKKMAIVRGCCQIRPISKIWKIWFKEGLAESNLYISHNFQGELLKNGKATCKMSKNIGHIGTLTPMLVFSKLENYYTRISRLRRGHTLGGHHRKWEPAHIFLFEKCVIVCKEGKTWVIC